jgi:hypothetical protein
MTCAPRENRTAIRSRCGLGKPTKNRKPKGAAVPDLRPPAIERIGRRDRLTVASRGGVTPAARPDHRFELRLGRGFPKATRVPRWSGCSVRFIRLRKCRLTGLADDLPHSRAPEF